MKTTIGTYVFLFSLVLLFVFSYQPKTVEACGICNAVSDFFSGVADAIGNAFGGGGGDGGSNDRDGLCGGGGCNGFTTREAAIAAGNLYVAGLDNAHVGAVTQARDGTWRANIEGGGNGNVFNPHSGTPDNPPSSSRNNRPWINASPCVVALGADACLSNMSWSFERVIGQRARSARQGRDSSFHGTNHFSHANSGSEQRWVNFSYNHFALYHDSRGRRGAPLASTIASLSCAAGSPQFDGSTTRCLCPAGQTPSGDNTSCLFPDGTRVPGPGPSNGPSNTGTPGPIGNPPPPPPPPPPPTNDVSLVTIGLDTNIVRSGTPGSGTVTVDSTGGASCVLSPASVTTNGSTTFVVGTGGQQTFRFTTLPLQNQLQVSVNCTPTAGAFTPGTSGNASATIEVIPQINEI